MSIYFTLFPDLLPKHFLIKFLDHSYTYFNLIYRDHWTSFEFITHVQLISSCQSYFPDFLLQFNTFIELRSSNIFWFTLLWKQKPYSNVFYPVYNIPGMKFEFFVKKLI